MTVTANDMNKTNATTRAILDLADAADLNPHYDEDGAHGQNGVARVIVSGPRRDSLFGAIYVSTNTGKVLHANLTHGNGGDEKRFEGGRAVRDVLLSWMAVTA